jgi:hypothetical protein
LSPWIDILAEVATACPEITVIVNIAFILLIGEARRRQMAAIQDGRVLAVEVTVPAGYIAEHQCYDDWKKGADDGRGH